MWIRNDTNGDAQGTWKHIEQDLMMLHVYLTHTTEIPEINKSLTDPNLF
jgi:hypothetical protein